MMTPPPTAEKPPALNSGRAAVGAARRKHNDNVRVMDNVSRSDQTRARLVEAAIGILAERGYRGLTFVEVCRRAELSRGAIHHHYSGINELLVDVVREIGERVLGGTAGQTISDAPASEVFAAGIDLVWNQMQTREFRALVQIRTAISTSEELLGSVRDEVRNVHKDWYAKVDAISAAASSRADPGVGRIVMSALAGAALIDMAIEPPCADPARDQFRSALKRLVLR